MKKNKGFEFSIAGITQNNLKNVDFRGGAGEIVLIAGVSGSGKSTLVRDVIVAEAQRQEAMRRKSDELYVYAIRPSFVRTTDLPACNWVSQRALTQTELSTFGTRTSIKSQIRKVFVENGRIFNRNIEIKKPSLVEIRQFARRFYPDAQLYAVFSAYTPVKSSDVQSKLAKQGIRAVFLRDEKGILKEVTVARLSKVDLSKYEVLIVLDVCGDDESVLALSKSGISLLGADIDLNFNEHYFDIADGTIFRKPSPVLFSKSGASSLSGRCGNCGGSGKQTTADLESVINATVPLEKGFLNVPLTKAGRYVAFKFLPIGLSTLLKKSGLDVRKRYDELPADAKDAIRELLTKKLLSNQSDENVAQYLSEIQCGACAGSGYSHQARAVQINGKPFDYYLSLSSRDLRSEVPYWELDETAFKKLDGKLELVEKLAIGHISLDRPTTAISSGEAQRLKLLDVLTSNDTGRIIVLDEPSSNLQYHDNLAILDAILQLKKSGNCILIVEHNALYASIADRIVEIGPGPGANGGHARELRPLQAQKAKNPLLLQRQPPGDKKFVFRVVALKPKRNVRLTSIKVPVDKITAVVGSSGSGKSTLVFDMMYSSLLSSGKPIIKLDSKPPGKSSASIVATYIEIFDEIRKVYAKAAAPYLNESDFSFNARGACRACGGSGEDGDKLCGVCFGSRYRPDVSLAKAKNTSIVDLLQRDIDQLDVTGEFHFLAGIRKIFDALSLSHLMLGRATSSLSGGELQRLKLAKFILNNLTKVEGGNATVILDEPSRGLDSGAVKLLHEALNAYMEGCTVVVIEHNPEFIYRCDYIIDLGQATGEKTDENVVVGRLGEKDFPSLNHAAVFTELHKIKKGNMGVVPHVVANEQRDTRDTVTSGRRFHLLHPLYLRQENFELERFFLSGFQVKVRDRNFEFFHHRDEMDAALKDAPVFLYNPFVTYLEKYSRVPASIQRTVISDCRGREIYASDDPWTTLVKAVSFEEAFLKGAGVVATHEGSFPGAAKCRYYGVRVFSLQERLIDRIAPSDFAFNLYRNACRYCDGYGHIRSYPFDEWLDKGFALADSKISYLGLNNILPKATIAYFVKEGLFDFTVPLAELSKEEFNILLYGFKAYRFRKPGKAGVAEDDFWEWRGLNSYIYRNASKLSAREDLNAYLKWKKCPFCTYGFRNSVTKYCRGGKSIESFLKIDSVRPDGAEKSRKKVPLD